MSSPLISAFLRLLRLGRPHWRLLGIAFVGMLAVGVSNGIFVFLTGPVLKMVLSGGASGSGRLSTMFPVFEWASRETVARSLVTMIVVVSLTKGIGYLAQFYFVGLFGQRVVADLRRSLFIAFSRMRVSQLTQRKSGELLSRLSSDIAAVEQAATYTVASWLRDGVQIIVLVLAAVSLSWKLALLAACAIPLAVWPASKLTRALLARFREGQSAVGSMAGLLHEGLGAQKTIRSLNAESFEVARLERHAIAAQHAFVRGAWAKSTIPAVMEVMASLALALSLGWAAGGGVVDPEVLVSFLTALVLMYQPAKDLGRVSQFALTAQVALERIDEVLQLAPAPEHASGAQSLEKQVELRGATLRWSNGRGLRDATLVIPAGRFVALVGASGSGKSTATALLAGLEPPSEGMVLFDGVPVSSSSSVVALCTQEPLLFADTVRQNLALANRSVSEETLWHALDLVGAKTLVEHLPQQLDTNLGERGVSLSVGQRQRLCLARALVSDRPLLILDEAFSALDAESERRIVRALRTERARRTLVLVTHRLETVEAADDIVVFENETIVQRGPHHALLSVDGPYRRLRTLSTALPGAVANTQS